MPGGSDCSELAPGPIEQRRSPVGCNGWNGHSDTSVYAILFCNNLTDNDFSPALRLHPDSPRLTSAHLNRGEYPYEM